MAEHLNQEVEVALSPFNAMGKPLGTRARESGYRECKLMGLDQARAVECTSATAEQLERDKPYEALNLAMKFLDLTGAYRLIAVLLCHAEVAP